MTKAAKTVKLKLGSKKATVNGNEETLSSAPLMHRDAVFAPIRVVAEGVGATVQFDSGANAMYISFS
ncbi:hypothetical protein PA598K_04209 [Paenibacillus sp. 598K]|nr:hypothetical protein PA598K_04209 [Paenibacillus sp. 598K]